MCKFSEAWIGKCKNEGEPYCEKHANEKCISCGKQATGSCDSTGQFVCGAPLCDNCEHTIFENGTNGGIGFNQQPLPEGMESHCPKISQKFKPWYDRDDSSIKK